MFIMVNTRYLKQLHANQLENLTITSESNRKSKRVLELKLEAQCVKVKVQTRDQ